jgi:hypothetical protein
MPSISTTRIFALIPPDIQYSLYSACSLWMKVCPLIH